MKKIHNKVINLYLNFEQNLFLLNTINCFILKRKEKNIKIETN